jgi:hypothetical protein
MKKSVLSNDQLQRVITFRDSGLSWVKIQEKSGIPRRVAQREYKEFQRKQSERQLKEARKEVVAEEYRVHLDLLTGLANVLVESLVIPEPMNDLRPADEVIDQLLKTDIYEERLSLRLRPGDPRRETLAKRMNTLLLKSLRDHTERRVPWEALEEWKTGRDNCIADIEKLKAEVKEVLNNILNLEPKLKDKVGKTKRDPRIWQQVADGVLMHLWLSSVMGKVSKVTAFEGGSAINRGTAWVKFHGGTPEQMELRFDSEDPDTNVHLAKEIVRVSNWSVENLQAGKKDRIKAIREGVSKMKQAAGALEAALNPLVLRPLILNTQCDICPV